MVSHAVTGSLRVMLYLLVLSASILVLYEMLKMRNDVYDEQPGGFCILWGGTWKNDTALVPFSGSKSVCEFVIFSSTAQIILSILMGVMAVVRMVTGRLKERSAFAYFELLLVFIAVLVALITSATVTGGLYKTCNQLLSGWAQDSGGYGAKPGSCNGAYFTWVGQDKYEFYHDVSLAQIGAWICTAMWMLHTALTCYNCFAYRRGVIDEPSAHVSMAAAEGRSAGSYKKLANEGDL
ncbi:uncharacterized protein LOC135813182 [Sycon ciliatum]|uniref:uncharacterized protein LOC135813182 n=1 Tax=Sycon ciliatum TaxID=27933 RepID=UPI0020A9ED3A|eukprot:scpid73209/ scgid34604/ 